MNKKIDINNFYQINKGVLTEENKNSVNNNRCGLSKLNLFSDEAIDVQSHWFFDLLENSAFEVKFSLEKKNESVFWSLYADYSVLQGLQVGIKNSKFDYLLWPEKNLLPPQLMLFDMDSTFIQIEVIDELAKFHQVGDEVALVTESAMRGELDFAQSLISRVACLEGLSEKFIGHICSNLPLSPGVLELVEAGKNNNCQTAIVSGGFSPFVEKLKNQLELFEVKANHLEIISGKLTGKLLGNIVDAKAKAVFLQKLCKELKISANQVIAIGDGANDLEMMQAAGFNLAYYSKPKVQEQANGRMNHSNLNKLITLFDW